MKKPTKAEVRKALEEDSIFQAVMLVERLDRIADQHDAALAGLSATVKVLEREVRKKLKRTRP